MWIIVLCRDVVNALTFVGKFPIHYATRIILEFRDCMTPKTPSPLIPWSERYNSAAEVSVALTHD